MAVTINSSTQFADAVTNSMSFSHSVVAGAKLSVRIGWSATGAVPSITSITYNGVAMDHQGTDGGGTNFASAVYTLDAPASGSNTVSITFSGNFDAGRAIAQDYANSFGFADTTADSQTSATPSVTVPNAANGDLIADVICTTNTLTVGANQTEDINGVVFSGIIVAASTQAGADGGDMSWSHTSSQWAMSAVRVLGTQPPPPQGYVPWNLRQKVQEGRPRPFAPGRIR